MRVKLLRHADDEWQLLWTTHHLCIDGWSWPRLFGEIAKIYAALSDGRPPALESALGYVPLCQMAGAPEDDLVGLLEGSAGRFRGTDARRPWSRRSDFGAQIGEPAAAVRDNGAPLARRRRKVFDCWLNRPKSPSAPSCKAAWALLLGHYADARDVVFGATLSGRPEQIDGIETLIGPCVTNVPVRAKFDPDELLKSWLSRLQAQQLDLIQHQFMPLDAIQGVSKVPWHHRLFDTLLVFQNYQVDAAIGRLGQQRKADPGSGPGSYQLCLDDSRKSWRGAELKAYLQCKSHRPRHDRGDSERSSRHYGGIGVKPANRDGRRYPRVHAGRKARSKPQPPKRPISCACRPAPSRRPQAERRRKSSSRSGKSCWEDRTSVSMTTSSTQAVSRSCSCACTVSSRALSACSQIVKLLEYPTIRTLAAHLNSSDGLEQGGRHAELTAERALKQRAAFARQRTKAKLV